MESEPFSNNNVEVDLDNIEVDPEGGDYKEVSADMIEQVFKPITPKEVVDKKTNFRNVKIPPNRLGPLKNHWLEVYKPIVEHLKLQIRFNTKTANVEIRVSHNLIYS